MGVPVLETERLILRGRSMADFPAYAAMWAEPAVTRHITGRPLNAEEAWTKFTRMSGFWALLGYGFWLVEEKASGLLIGEAGVGDFRREIVPPLAGKPEFGWVFAGAAQGKGYATEAARAGLSWAEAKFPGATMCCLINEDNAASVRVAEKLGFREAARAAYLGSAVIVFER